MGIFVSRLFLSLWDFSCLTAASLLLLLVANFLSTEGDDEEKISEEAKRLGNN